MRDLDERHAPEDTWKKQPHQSILTLDDLDKNNWKHSLLITQLQARYQTLKEPGNGKPNQTSEDFSI